MLTIGQMYEDSIQELNNLIGELDLFQREHDQEMKHKQRQPTNPHKPVPNSHDVHRIAAADTAGMMTTTTSSNAVKTSDICDSSESSTMRSNDRNMSATDTSHSSEMAYGSDVVDSINDLTDCQATTMSLKLNLSTTEYPLVLENNSNSSSRSNHYSILSNTSMASPSTPNAVEGSKATANCIELIPDSYNVSDDYVKEYSEIVVLRRKDSQNDLNGAGGSYERSSTHPVNTSARNVEKSDIKRASSFRCSSFAKTGSNDLNDSSSPQKCRIDEQTNEMHVSFPVDHGSDSHCAASQTILHKPVITPRPASLSGLFVCLFAFMFLYLFLGFFSLTAFIIIYFIFICRRPNAKKTHY